MALGQAENSIVSNVCYKKTTKKLYLGFDFLLIGISFDLAMSSKDVKTLTFGIKFCNSQCNQI